MLRSSRSRGMDSRRRLRSERRPIPPREPLHHARCGRSLRCIGRLTFWLTSLNTLRSDPGDLSREDIAENELGVREGFRVLSAYTLSNGVTKIWIITEADRSSTVVLLPSEY